MANPLTGDFDVVAQFAIPAVNRVLAAMHRIERFPHSLSMRVKDIPGPRVDVFHPSVVAVLDSFGEAVSDQDEIGNPRPFPGLAAATDAVLFGLDPIVNIGNAGIGLEPLQPSNLQGRAQLQLFAPTVEVPDTSGTNITVHLPMLSRYIADKDTSPAAEFMRGDLRLTVPVHQVASQDVNVVEIDIKANTIGINFVPQWSSRPLPAEDLLAIHRLIRNALRTSFLPSNSTLPSNIAHMQFRTVKGSSSAVAALLNMSGGPGNRNSASNVFLAPADHFAFGVSSDFVHAAFQPTLDNILATQVQPVSFTINGLVHTWHITYTIVLTQATVALKNGEIVVTVKGRATTGSWTPNFNFTVTLKFSLQPDGDSAQLVPGDVSIDTSSWIIDRFRGRMTSRLREVRDGALAESGAQGSVRKMLSAKENLGGFLDSLIKPARPKPGEATPPSPFTFQYSSIDISPVGLVLHGLLSLPPWPQAHAEYERVAVNNSGPMGATTPQGFNDGPDYSALKSWIPGGTILRYEWKPMLQTTPGFIDENTFIYSKPGPGLVSEAAASFVSGFVSGYRPLCVTVSGSRLSASGPIVPETVSATVCGINSFPIVGGFATEAELPVLALAQPNPEGRVEIVGHTSARPAKHDETAPNLLVHFADSRTAGRLGFLVEAVRDAGRDDAPTAVMVITNNGEASKAEFVDGITYAEDQDGAWERRFGLTRLSRPATVIVSTRGTVVWQHEGEIDREKLAAALRKTLVDGGRVEAAFRTSALKLGLRPPNFLFEYAPGREVTLRKMAGRPVVMVFWRSTSKQSMDLISEIERTAAGEKSDGTLVLAINDGEPPELARKAAAEHKFKATVVTDPARNISTAYGVNSWPTTVGTDATGAVRAVRFGRLSGEAPDSSVTQTTTDYERKGQ